MLTRSPPCVKNLRPCRLDSTHAVILIIYQILRMETIKKSTAETIPRATGEVDGEGAPTIIKRSNFLYSIANNVTWALSKLVYSCDGSSTSEPSPYLSVKRNFAPVSDELAPENLAVSAGEIPTDLNGTYIRVGPNPYYKPIGRYHWFSGDGMVHGVTLKDGKAAYSNAWVKTNRLAMEKKAGYPVFADMGDFRGVSGLFHIMLDKLKIKCGVIRKKHGSGTANTALAVHAGKVMALNEGDMPYQLRIACSGLIETIGRMTYDGKLDHAFTAHPKVDPDGDIFFFGYNVEKKPYVKYSYADSKGKKPNASVPIDLPNPIMMHDMAITERYVLFLDMPLVFKPEIMVKEKQLPFVFDKSCSSRIGVLPKYASDASELRWFTIPKGPYMCFHTANAYEDEDNHLIKLYLCLFREFSLSDFTKEGSLPILSEVTLDLQSGETLVKHISYLSGDFPTINSHYVGRRNQFCYIALMHSDELGVPDFYGIGKFDLRKSEMVAMYKHGEGRCGGEAYFAPKYDQGREVQEDEGWLMTYVYDSTAEHSELVIVDAQSFVETARIKLPRRVPHGFHSLWVKNQS